MAADLLPFPTTMSFAKNHAIACGKCTDIHNLYS